MCNTQASPSSTSFQANKTMENLSSFEQEALKQFERLFQGNEGKFRHVGRAISILEQFPRLAGMQVGGSKPLNHFLKSPASKHLSIIQTVYDKNPTVVAEHDLEKDEDATAFHIACSSKFASDDVIEFLFHKNPSAAYICNRRGLSPLVYLFLREGEARLTVLRRILQAGGSVKSSRDNPRAKEIDLLATAMSIGCSPEVYQLLWEFYPKEEVAFHLVPEFHAGYDRLDLPEAEMLAQMLPQMKRLVCQPRVWTPPAMDRMATCLAHNNQLEELDISLDSNQMDPASCELWRKVLEQCTTLQKVKIRAEPHVLLKRFGRVVPTFRSMVSNHVDDEPLLESLLRGLSGNHTLQELELSCFQFPDKNILPDFLTTPGCSLQRLHLTHCYLPSYEWLRHGLLAHAPLLQELHMTFRQEPEKPQPLDMTHTLVWILDTMKHLETLKLGKTDPTHRTSVAAQAPDLLQALQRNKTLKSLSVHSLLEQERHARQFERILQTGANTTLTEIGYASFGEGLYSSWGELHGEDTPEKLGRIPYYLLWNKLDRSSLHESGITKLKWIEMLTRVQSAFENNLAPTRYHLDILFDLMLETPGYWTN